MSEAVAKHPEADVLVNFASLRSAYEASVEAMTYKQVRYTHMYMYVRIILSVSLPILSVL